MISAWLQPARSLFLFRCKAFLGLVLTPCAAEGSGGGARDGDEGSGGAGCEETRESISERVGAAVSDEGGREKRREREREGGERER